jgi:peptidyl-prolyl cis-trans isomerase A (cyclophilin A)
MARIGGQVNSATSEWFVNLVNNTQLDFVDQGFTVFAEIISGMSVVDAIGNLPRSNQQSTLGSAFGELPLTNQDSDGVQADDVVLVHRIYVTDVIIDDPNGTDGGTDGGTDSGTDDVVTTATYNTVTTSFSMPVRIGEEMYRVIMVLDSEADGVGFSVDTTRIISLNDVGQEAATMDLDAGTLVIPSVKVGTKVFNEVTFSLTDFSTLSFRLTGYTPAP